MRSRQIKVYASNEVSLRRELAYLYSRRMTVDGLIRLFEHYERTRNKSERPRRLKTA